jgi:hypothetical protein
MINPQRLKSKKTDAPNKHVTFTCIAGKWRERGGSRCRPEVPIQFSGKRSIFPETVYYKTLKPQKNITKKFRE